MSSFLILGDYSGVIIELHLKRRFLYYIIQMYLPAVMVVMLSWVGSTFLLAILGIYTAQRGQ